MYGLSRLHRVLLDLPVVGNVASFAAKPLLCFAILAAPLSMIGSAPGGGDMHAVHNLGCGARDYARRFLDMVSIFFLIKLTKRPLRFFDAAVPVTFALGLLLGSWMVVERLLVGAPLANRPTLPRSTPLVLPGLHFLALSMLGAPMIFTRARQLRDYNVGSVRRFTQPATDAANAGTLPRRKVGIRS
jgi:hypothetical protein